MYKTKGFNGLNIGWLHRLSGEKTLNNSQDNIYFIDLTFGKTFFAAATLKQSITHIDCIYKDCISLEIRKSRKWK